MPKCNVILHIGIYVNIEEKTVSMDAFRRDLYNKAIAIEMAAWHSLLFVSPRLCSTPFFVFIIPGIARAVNGGA